MSKHNHSCEPRNAKRKKKFIQLDIWTHTNLLDHQNYNIATIECRDVELNPNIIDSSNIN